MYCLAATAQTWLIVTHASIVKMEGMPNQIMDYYSSHKERLLKDFDRTSGLAKGWLDTRYGKEFATTLQNGVRQESLSPALRCGFNRRSSEACPPLRHRARSPS